MKRKLLLFWVAVALSATACLAGKPQENVWFFP